MCEYPGDLQKRGDDAAGRQRRALDLDAKLLCEVSRLAVGVFAELAEGFGAARGDAVLVAQVEVRFGAFGIALVQLVFQLSPERFPLTQRRSGCRRSRRECAP